MSPGAVPQAGFDRLLVPVDFSEHGGRILEIARRAARPGATIVLLHVVEWLPSVSEAALGIYANRKEIDKTKQLSEEKLGTLASRLEGREVVLEVREGRPSLAILEAIEEHEPELVVMGTQGRSGLDHLLIGSVAERVVRKTTRDVLLVRS